MKITNLLTTSSLLMKNKPLKTALNLLPDSLHQAQTTRRFFRHLATLQVAILLLFFGIQTGGTYIHHTLTLAHTHLLVHQPVTTSSSSPPLPIFDPPSLTTTELRAFLTHLDSALTLNHLHLSHGTGTFSLTTPYYTLIPQLTDMLYQSPLFTQIFITQTQPTPDGTRFYLAFVKG